MNRSWHWMGLVACTFAACGLVAGAATGETEDSTVAEAATPTPTPAPWVEVPATEDPVWAPPIAQAVWLRRLDRPVEAAELLEANLEHRAATAAWPLLAGVARAEAEEWEAAATHLERVVGEPGLVGGFAAWQLGRVELAREQPAEALAAWALVPADSPWWAQAQLDSAELNCEGEGAGAAIQALRAVEGQLRPAEPRAYPLALARCHLSRGAEGDSEAAAGELLALWRAEPRTTEGTEAWELLSGLMERDPGLGPSAADRAEVAWQLAAARRNAAAARLLEPVADELDGLSDPRTRCRGLYALGQSLARVNEYGPAAPVLESVDTACEGLEEDAQVKALYLLGRSRGALRNRDGAVEAYVAIADRFPHHTYADDGLFKAAGLLESARPADSRALLERMVREFPEGDMHGRAVWTLVSEAIDAGDMSTAQELLAFSVEQHQPSGPHPHREFHLQARYWQARLGPADPDRPARWSAEERGQAVERFATLATEFPLHWYGILAYRWLESIDSEHAALVAAGLSERWSRSGTPRSTLRVDRALAESSQAGLAAQLLELGLAEEAADELMALRRQEPEDGWVEPDDSLSWLAARLLAAGRPNVSHNLLRMRFRQTHPEQLTPETLPSLRQAYPRAYGDQIARATNDKDVPAHLFQALVREESAFTRAIRSHAGAMGLSQLMWGTAQDTARRMGISVTRDQLADPDTNLSIGAYFLNGLFRRYEDHPVFSLAGYNAGPGRVNQWLEERGELPIDEWVEEIPFNETRNYVKRVLTSNQIYLALYRDQYGEQERVFIDLPIGTAAPLAGR